MVGLIDQTLKRCGGSLANLVTMTVFINDPRHGDRFVELRKSFFPDGNYPAREYMLASIARDIIRHRRRVGLTQVELARRAGIRPETLCRVESGKYSPTIGTVEKIDRALREAEG